MIITQMVHNRQQQRVGELAQKQQDPSRDPGKPFDTSIPDGYRQGGGSSAGQRQNIAD